MSLMLAGAAAWRRGAASDPFWSLVRLLVHFSGPNNSTSFVDRSPAGHTLTAVGTARVLGNRLELDGIGSWVQSPDSNDWPLIGDFTREVFGVVFDTPTHLTALISHYDAYSPVTNNRGWSIWARNDSGELDPSVSTTGTGATATSVAKSGFMPLAGVPYDVCFERAGTTVRLYIDGVMIGKQTYSSSSYNSSSPLAIGAANARSTDPSIRSELDGRIAAVRFTNAARYASDSGYTVPSLPLPVS